jgi:hypothetical protein
MGRKTKSEDARKKDFTQSAQRTQRAQRRKMANPGIRQERNSKNKKPR